jgi:hypothetical protein
MIVAQTLTDQDDDDPSQLAPLLDQIDILFARVRRIRQRLARHPASAAGGFCTLLLPKIGRFRNTPVTELP